MLGLVKRVQVVCEKKTEPQIEKEYPDVFQGIDKVTVQIDGVLFWRVLDPFTASYGVVHPEYAVTWLAQTTMHSELGKLTLDKVLREKESLTANIVHSINQASDEWGIKCLHYGIKDICSPLQVNKSGQMQVEAELKKKATVLESEGTREASINVAKEAQAVLAKAEAEAKAIHLLSEALTEQNGNAAASLSAAEQHVFAVFNLAIALNTILLPSNTGNLGGLVSQAITSTLAKPCPKESTEGNKEFDSKELKSQSASSQKPRPQ
ncbi:stomatin-like protein 2, mitochondrial [Pholidichthys leucotaenia]